MKTANAGLQTTLLTKNAHLCADLYSFYFGPTIGWNYFTSADTDIVSGSTTWVSSGRYLSRGSARATTGVEVSTIEITIASGSFTVAGSSVVQASLKGLLDGVRVKIDRAYMETWGSVPNGVLNVFDGSVIAIEPSNTEVRLTVKSNLARLNELTPRRLFQPQCPYLVYDASCGATQASFTDARTVAAGTTVSTLVINTSSTRAVVGSRVQFTSGVLSGGNYTVVSVAGTSLGLFPRMPSVPSNGDTLNVIRGCDKTRATCTSVFSNIARFGGFPDAPKPQGKL